MEDKILIAHLKKENDNWDIQSLEDHLNGTAEFAEHFALKFGDDKWGKLLGQLHDLGKYSADFQAYIRKNSGYDESLCDIGKTDHTSAGAIYSKSILENAGYPEKQAKMAAYAIAGHHAGLLNWVNEIGISGNLQSRLEKKDLLQNIQEFISEISACQVPQSQPCKGRLNKMDYFHLWMRMLFSCLVDADRLDTERFMNPDRFHLRGNYLSIEELKKRFDSHMSYILQHADRSKINEIRADILSECRKNGKSDTGIFSITVPTGGGKTLSSMAWALEHAFKTGKDRIIVAIPFTSIITQTAEIFRNIFGQENVVEHHSDVQESNETTKGKLATENWDAPIIVTTNVQLFESLFSSKTSRCRKLHNIVNSNIILDEVQVLPPQFLKPIISILQGLNHCFDVSILLSTATQPALVGSIGAQEAEFCGFPSANVKEIAGNIHFLSEELKRVDLHIPEVESPVEWESLAQKLIEHDQVLCIVSTRRDCRELYELMPEDTIHLSRMMCSEHISRTIAEIKEKLKRKEPIRVISTQLIEAGVDIDFPFVYRSFTGLDSVAQSAGRCNREGRLNDEGKLGQVNVFYPPRQAPVGLMRKGCDAMTEILSMKQENLFSPDSFFKYFRSYYGKILNFDTAEIYDNLVRDADEMKFQFATVSRKFRLINDDGSTPVFVMYGVGEKLISELNQYGPERFLLRKLQRYSVSYKVQ